jgi:methyl-accepting chemotaxis protein
VKELANRTSKATDEASARIGSVRQATIQAVSVIREIAANLPFDRRCLGRAKAATAEIAPSVEEAARRTEQVTGQIMDVKQGAGEAGAAASRVLG